MWFSIAIAAACLLSVTTLSAFSQQDVKEDGLKTGTSAWIRKNSSDSFSGVSLVTFTLTGRFLDPPQHGNLAAPVWITVCEPKRTHNGKDLYDGLLAKSYIDFGSVLSSTINGLPIVYRLDDGKPKAELWSSGTAGTAAFLDRNSLNTVLYAHFMPHRANSNPPTKKLVVKVAEFNAASIVAEFDIPDPDEIARTCGTTYHKD
jgi:hypothetical protein